MLCHFFPAQVLNTFLGALAKVLLRATDALIVREQFFSGDFEQFFGRFTHEGSSFPRAVQRPRLQAVVIKTKSGNGEKSAREFIIAIKVGLPIWRYGLGNEFPKFLK